jgi:hypothetical protein
MHRLSREMSRWIGTFGLATLLGACGADAGSRAEGFEVLEEGGARVVLNHLPAAEPGTWTISPAPRLVLGDAAADGLRFQRILQAYVLPDGRIVVVDAGSPAFICSTGMARTCARWLASRAPCSCRA